MFFDSLLNHLPFLLLSLNIRSSSCSLYSPPFLACSCFGRVHCSIILPVVLLRPRVHDWPTSLPLPLPSISRLLVFFRKYRTSSRLRLSDHLSPNPAYHPNTRPLSVDSQYLNTVLLYYSSTPAYRCTRESQWNYGKGSLRAHPFAAQYLPWFHAVHRII
ncbi:hypothetical protein BGY98DRAFT_94253 [Russula aff. rugulosa BPL654]|nr:hypothetical protein BGY98DRAFT_94253 [Russula aff. rugulosa BPL654]